MWCFQDTINGLVLIKRKYNYMNGSRAVEADQKKENPKFTKFFHSNFDDISEFEISVQRAFAF